MTETLTTNGAVPIIPFTDPRAGISWLERAFGAVATLVVPPERDQPLKHAEVKVGNGLVMIDDADRTDSPFALRAPSCSTSWWTTLTRCTTGRSRAAPRSSWG